MDLLIDKVAPLVLPKTPPPITRAEPSPWAHQCEAWHLSRDLGGVMLAHEMGCVDGETEYLSPQGWKKISEYDGGLVAQVQIDDGNLRKQYVKPERYIRRREWMPGICFAGFQTVTFDHRMLVYDDELQPHVIEAHELRRRLLLFGQRYYYADRLGPVEPDSLKPYSNSPDACCLYRFDNSYCFTVPSGFLLLRRERGAFVTGNCGKSRTAIDILQNDSPGPILVLCPKAVIATWPHEVAKHAVDPWPVLTLRVGNTGEKMNELRGWLKRHGTTRTMVVTNYETLQREPMKSGLGAVPWAGIVCDESHRIKSPNGIQSRIVARIAEKSRTWRRLALTGTPIPHSPLDLFGQFRFVDPSVFGPSYISFRARYASTHPEFPSKVLRWLNLEDMTQRFYSRAHRVRSADVLDLPPRIFSQVFVQLGSKARKAYDSLRDELVAEIDGGVIDAANVLVKLLRLQQIAGGAVKAETTDGGEIEVEIDSAKEEALSEILEDLGEEPLVVFCRFKAELDRVRRIAQRHGVAHGELSGRYNDLDGNRLPDWGGRKGVFGVQIQSGGAGVDLTRSCACVYWSLGFSLGEYEQSLARLHRPGQSRPVRYWQLIAEDTVDEAVYKALAARADVANYVLRGGI